MGGGPFGNSKKKNGLIVGWPKVDSLVVDIGGFFVSGCKGLVGFVKE